MQVAATHTGDVVRLQPIHDGVSGYGRVSGGGGVAVTPVVDRLVHRPALAVHHHRRGTYTRSTRWRGRSYVVHSGDTLSGIGAKVGRSWPQLWRANSRIVHNPDLIFPGQRLRVPGHDAPSLTRHVAKVPAETADRRRLRTAHHHATIWTNHASGVWAAIAQCESGGNWAADTGNGFFGGLQFTLSSWHAAGGSGMPNQATPSEQIRVAINLQRMQGWGAWPVCSARAGV